MAEQEDYADRLVRCQTKLKMVEGKTDDKKGSAIERRRVFKK